MTLAARDEVTRTVASQPGRLRRGSAVAVLALLSASALAPVAVAVAGGSAVAAALAGVAGNLGSGYVTEVIERIAMRLRRKSAGALEHDQVRDALADALRAALEKDDDLAQGLRAELLDLLEAIGGVDAAIEAARADLRDHIVESFRELTQQQLLALQKLRDIGAEQRRQGRDLRDQRRVNEEVVDRLRRLTQRVEQLASGAQSSPGPPAVVARPMIVPVTTAPELGVESWRGGSEVAIGDHLYLLHDDFLEERYVSDHSVLRRQARGTRLVPAGGYAWLRQVEIRRDAGAARSALQAVADERDLLDGLRGVRGVPRVEKFVPGRRSAGLVVGWPASRSTEAPCETLDAFLGAARIDPWRLHRLIVGLAGLCGTLAKLHDRGVAHRFLTPAGIVMLDNGSLVLRDLGLAARRRESGEAGAGPAGYQAPEQHSRGRGSGGPQTDVYQLAAVAYHIITGVLPHAVTPLPVAAQVPEVPEQVARVLDAALTPDPADRPDIRTLGAAFRSARSKPS